MSIHQDELCREVEESIADVLEGQAPARLVDHIAGCDTCRDLKYEAEQASEMIASAGADFRASDLGVDRIVEQVLAQRPDGPQPNHSITMTGPASSAAPRTSGVTQAAQSSEETKASATAPTELAPVFAGAAAELLPASPVDNNATVFEPNRFAEEQAVEGPMAATQIEPPPAPPAPTVVDEAASSAIQDPFVPTVKTVPLSAVMDLRKEKVHQTPVSTPSEGEAHRPVEAVTGRNNTGPSAGSFQTQPGASAPAQARVPDLDVKAAHTKPSVGATKPAQQGQVVSLFRRKGFIAALAGGMAAAAAFGAFMVNKNDKPVDENTAFSEGAWSGTVASVTRAASDGADGLEICASKGGCRAGTQGGAIEPGSTIKTDSKTRARIKLADESWIAIDRNSEVTLPGGDTRVAKVERGLVVAEVKEVKGAQPAKLILPQGEVTVPNTKVAATVTERRASIEVVRGWVDVASASGTTVKVRSGEEATIEDRGDPIVAASTNLSDAVGWTTEGQATDEASALRGLGELRAKKPGETTERAKAVKLEKASVKVRVVDLVARVEIDETFTNQTDEELEGIFRFPLPPDAQIENLSLEVDGVLRDGAFVERDRGAAIWRGVIQNAAPKAPKPREEIIWVAGPWRDPALLEWQRGGRFELRIFPIPKKGSRRVVLKYTQQVPQSGGVRRFTYPLAHDASGSTKIDDFSFDVQVLGNDKEFGVEQRGYQLVKADSTSGGDRFTLNEKNFVPAGDLTVEYALPNRKQELTAWAYELPPDTQTASVSNQAPTISGPAKDAKGNLTAAERAKQAEAEAKALSDDGSPFVALAVRPKLPRFPEGKERLHVIVVDSSRSMVGERYARARQLASGLVKEMDRRDSFLLLACDTTCQAMGATTGRSIPAPSAPGADAAGQVDAFLGSIDPEGGSNLLAVVQAARRAASVGAGKELRIIYLGDGTPTVGPTKASSIESAVRHELPSGEGSVVAVALGTDADTSTLQALARAGNGVVVPFVPGQSVGAASVDVLAAAYGSVLSDVEVILPAGLTEITPSRLDPVAAGGETFVYARMTGGKEINGDVIVRGRVGRDKFEQKYPAKIASTTNAGNAFVPRLFAAAKIADLEKTGVADDQARVVALSKRFQVASRHTSLLVLESEAMDKAFGLDRKGIKNDFSGESQASSASADVEGEAGEEADGDAGFGDDEAKGKGRRSADKKESRIDALAEPAAEAAAPAGPSAGGSGGFTPRPSATSAPPPAKAAKPTSPADDPFSPNWGTKNSEKRPVSRPAPNMIPMRRIFERRAQFQNDTLSKELVNVLAEAETAQKASPDSRDKTIALYRALMASGRIGEAQELTAKWSEKDALDPDALLARADLAAMNGDRSRAIRILSGLADVRPGEKAVQRRLASAFTQLGAPDFACQHRLALADLDPNDVNAVASAVRCSQDQGLSELSRTLLANAPTSLRDKIDTTSRTLKLNEAPALAGDVKITATWNAPVDLDIALVDKTGRRFSWLGSTAQLINVTAKDGGSTSTETIAVSNLNQGTFNVEVVRAAGDTTNRGPITGEITFTFPGGQTKKQAFTLNGNRAEVGSVRVFFESRLVPVNQFGGGGWRGPTTF